MGLAFHLRSSANSVQPQNSSPQPAFISKGGYNGIPKFGCYGQLSLAVPLPMEIAHVCCEGLRIPIRTAGRKDFLP
jgi:hypothetical protein